MAKSPAWQRKEGKNPSGGLNAKGRASYNRATGGNLKAPSKKVGNKRRASFCARMKGMKKKLTSSKTANDPNLASKARTVAAFVNEATRSIHYNPRFWGFVPEDHLLGKAVAVWFSIEPDSSIIDGLRKERIFSSIK